MITHIVKYNDKWPEGISDGLTIKCADCGEIPKLDYSVRYDFWNKWVPKTAENLGVVCLECLDKRCNGEGLAEALISLQFVGINHTTLLMPIEDYKY